MRPSHRNTTCVRDIAGETHLVRRDEHRHALARELAHEREHLGDELGVERARDLVEQHHAVAASRARARSRRAAAVRPRAGRGTRRACPTGRCGTRRSWARSSASAVPEPEHLPRRERHVLHHRHVREQVEALEDDADVLAQRVHVDAAPGDAVAVDADLAALDRLEPVDAAQQRRLPAARRPDEAHDLVLVDA